MNFSLTGFITIAIAIFLAVVSFWAAFGPNNVLNRVNGNNWGEGAFWRAMYGMVGFGCLGAVIAELQIGWAERIHGRISNTYRNYGLPTQN